MRKLLIICIFLTVHFINAQDKEYQKITFEYVIVPKLKFEENQLFGSIELLKREFPNQKITPCNDIPANGIIPYSALTDLNLNSIYYFISHCSNKIYGEYDKATNCTRFKNYLDATLLPNNLKKMLNIKKSMELIQTSRVDHTNRKIFVDNKEAKNLKKSEYRIEEDASGKEYIVYNQNYDDRTYIDFSEELPSFVTPDLFFKDSSKGVKSIKNIFSTGTLVSITYQ